MDRNFFYRLTNEDTIFVEYRTDRGEVVSFVVKLLCDIHGRRYEVIRYDSAHGCPHKDTLDTEGHVISDRKVWYYYLSNSVAFTTAIDDIEQNYEFYRERFVKWLRVN